MIKKITLELGSKFPYIDTDVPFERSTDEIIKLLKKFKCDEILTYQNGDEFKIACRKGGWPYLIEFPLTYVRRRQKPLELNMRISGRIVYNRVKSTLIDATMDDGEFREAMFRYLAIPTQSGMVLLADVVEAQKDKIIKVGLTRLGSTNHIQHNFNIQLAQTLFEIKRLCKSKSVL